MLEQDIIEKCETPQLLPIILIQKKNGKLPEDPETWRFTVNYMKVNVQTIFPRYPIHCINELFLYIKHTVYIATSDLTNGYFLIPVQDSDILKTAFILPWGVCTFKYVQFGLSRAAANFQRLMEAILGPVLNTFYHVYLDNIIVTSATFADHFFSEKN